MVVRKVQLLRHRGPRALRRRRSHEVLEQEVETMNRCRRCGKDAKYFTDTYNPNTRKNDTFYLCEGCQRLLLMALRDFNSELGVWL